MYNGSQVVLTSLKDRTIILTVEDGKVVGRGTINGVENCVLERVFVYSTTSWGLPKVRSCMHTWRVCDTWLTLIVCVCVQVQHIEIHGRDPSGNPIMEKKLP